MTNDDFASMTESRMTRKFRLNRADGKFMGVCSGLADYFGIDALLIRVGFVASVLFGFGMPLLLYFVIALVAD